MTAVLGLDLSLTSTGIVCAVPDDLTCERVRTTTAKPDLHRLRHIRDAVALHFGHVDLAAVEGPSYGHGRQGGEHVRAGLWWAVADAADLARVPLLVVPPAVLKVYATGKGNASKDAVLAAVVKRYGDLVDITGNDVADAMVLAAIAARMTGEPLEESLPQTHLRALAKLALP